MPAPGVFGALYKGPQWGILQGMKQVHDDISAVSESPDAFDDNFFDQWLDRSGHAVFAKISSGEAVRTEEMMILVLRSQTRTSRRLESEFRREMKVLREEIKELRRDMDKRFAEMREDMNRRFAEMREDMDRRFTEMREDMDRRFTAMRGDMNSVFSTVKWMIALCSGVIVTLITLYRFLR